MNTIEHTHAIKITNFRSVAGVILILAGGVLFLDRYLKTGWLSLAIVPCVGLFLYFWGVRLRHFGLIMAGGLMSGVGVGVMAAWGPAIQLTPGVFGTVGPARSLITQVGYILIFCGLGWGLVLVTSTTLLSRPVWWAMIPGGILGAMGSCFLFSSLHWTDLVLYAVLGIGLPLLLWGMVSRLFGLIIPGCLLAGIGPGIYLAWHSPSDGNGLTQTGIMLMWFALGWLLMTMGGRWITHKYIWWPLIPGGILAMVGMGLYIGGDPTHALGFIGNTGSIALVIFGLYLLLMRKGIHH